MATGAACDSGRTGDLDVESCALGCADLFSRHISAVCERCRCRLCSACTPPSAPPVMKVAVAIDGCAFSYQTLVSWQGGWRAEITLLSGWRAGRSIVVDFGRASAVKLGSPYGAIMAVQDSEGDALIFTPARPTFGFMARAASQPTRDPSMHCLPPSPPPAPPPYRPSLPPPRPPNLPPPPPHPHAPRPSPPPSPLPPAIPPPPATRPHITQASVDLTVQWEAQQLLMVVPSILLLLWCAFGSIRHPVAHSPTRSSTRPELGQDVDGADDWDEVDEEDRLPISINRHANHS